MVFGDAFNNAFDQTAVPSFVIFVKEGFAFGAEDRDGANVFAGHKSYRILNASCDLSSSQLSAISDQPIQTSRFGGGGKRTAERF